MKKQQNFDTCIFHCTELKHKSLLEREEKNNARYQIIRTLLAIQYSRDPLTNSVLYFVHVGA